MTPLLLLAGLTLAFFAVTWHADELFCVSVRGGRALVVRGRIPPALLADLSAVVARPPVARATLRAMKDAGDARLVVEGVPDGAAQRLRNAFALYPIAKLRAAPRVPRPTLGQGLGVPALAWWCERRASGGRS